jgi:hypothetical protein
MNDTDDAVFVVEVRATDPVTLHRELAAAEGEAAEKALEEGCHGVLVTQHDFGHFTVAVSSQVPHGQTRERRAGVAKNLRRIDQWQLLADGVVVEVRSQGELYRIGEVDDVMPNGSGLWLAAEGGRGREYVDKVPGLDIWADAYLLVPCREQFGRRPRWP